MQITHVEPIFVRVSSITTWTFVRVHTDAGLSGVGEASASGNERLLDAAIRHLADDAVGLDARRPSEVAKLAMPAPFGRDIHFLALSALEQAMWDVLGKSQGAPVSTLLGGARNATVSLYANVNRATSDRRPEGFASSARAAVEDGFQAVKCAPFDGVWPGSSLTGDGRRAVHRGLQRLDAVREAIGGDALLMVDCHGRFSGSEAVELVRALEDVSPYWVEDPVADDDPQGWARVRECHGQRLAGGEHKVSSRELVPPLSARIWDVVCPDVKYCGGVAGLAGIAALADAFGARFVPHNPSGPVATAATAHVCSTLADGFMEYQWGESAWRAALVGGGEQVEGGHLVLPETPGLGLELSTELVDQHRFTPDMR